MTCIHWPVAFCLTWDWAYARQAPTIIKHKWQGRSTWRHGTVYLGPLKVVW